MSFTPMARARTKTAMLAVVMLAPCGSGGAQAQEGARYTMERSENGYVRLDTRTGEMSICREREDQFVCQMAADERRAFEEDIAALEDRVAALEEAVGEGRLSDLPSDEEIDRTMGIMETFMRRFFDIVEDLNRDFGTDTPDENLPDDQRT